jgi:hypothetical protein
VELTVIASGDIGIYTPSLSVSASACQGLRGWRLPTDHEISTASAVQSNGCQLFLKASRTIGDCYTLSLRDSACQGFGFHAILNDLAVSIDNEDSPVAHGLTNDE